MEESQPPVKLAIVDDEELLLDLLEQTLGSADWVDLLWLARDGQEAIEKIATDPPEVIMVDYQMPRMNGLELVKYLKEHHPDIRIVMLSSHDDEQTIFHLFNAEINSYLLKGERLNKVKKAIQAVRTGNQFFPEYVYRALRKMYQREQKRRETQKSNLGAQEKSPFTDQETEVLKRLCQPLSNAEVAEQLEIARRTVDTHRSNIISKTEAKNLFGAAMIALRKGWIDLETDAEPAGSNQ